MSLKTLIFFGLLAVALGFTLPEEQVDAAAYAAPNWANAEIVPISDDVVLLRRVRSPQGSVEGRLERDGDGSRASVDYRHQINKDLDVYASARRDFSRNDNSGHVGLEYRF